MTTTHAAKAPADAGPAPNDRWTADLAAAWVAQTPRLLKALRPHRVAA